jgi:hypothetical protein
MKNFATVLTFVAIAVGLYFAFTAPKSDTMMGDMMMGEHDNMNDMMGHDAMMGDGKKIPFASFVKQGGSYECTVHQYIGGADTMGTIFVHDDMMRGEFATKVSNMNVETTFVTKDGYNYSWSSMMPKTVYKMKMMPMMGDMKAPSAGSYSFNAEQIGDYDCMPWSLDDSKFALPAGATTVEMMGKTQ